MISFEMSLLSAMKLHLVTSHISFPFLRGTSGVFASVFVGFSSSGMNGDYYEFHSKNNFYKYINTI